MVGVFAALIVGFSAMLFSHLPGVFCAPEEDMDYAWFVPLFSVYVLWRERNLLRASLGRPSLVGALLTLPFVLIGFLGVRGVQVRFELIGFIGLLITVPWAFFGRECAKRVFFPAACLLFCMPMASYLSLLTVHLRLFVSAVSSAILPAFGVDVVRHGNMITMPGILVDGEIFGVDIANPCSGLRSIYALLAIFVAYGYFSQSTWIRRIAFAAFALPFAVVGNIVRISSICIVADKCSPSLAVGFHHDFSPFVVFGVAIGLMLLLEVAFNRMLPDVAPRAPAAILPQKIAPFAALPCALVMLFVMPVMFCQVMAPQAAVAQPPSVKFVRFDGFVREDVPPAMAETNLLRGAIIEKARYKMPNGFWFDVSAVISGVNKSSLHRPELCLPSQGFTVKSSRKITAAGVDWTVISVGFKGAGDGLYAYTFANQDGYRTASHEARIFRDIIDRTFRNTIDRWAMVSVLVPMADERAFVDFILADLGEMLK